MSATSAPSADLSWILDELVNVPHTRHAVLLSADGLLTAASSGVDRELGETVAAIASGMQSLSRAGAAFASGDPNSPWEQTLTQFGNSFLVLMAAGDGSYLAVGADRDADIADVSYRMLKTIDRVGQTLAIAPRQDRTGSA
ncbi:roadblock/LC7 domain-containing protein [Streptomyces sp. NPDC001843]|uniref:roadblock/LC7 domain-containing protein n=1 Tax=Streptomyces sp. NPDC001843 TaxID=3364617 RepID=UPI0036B48E6D